MLYLSCLSFPYIVSQLSFYLSSVSIPSPSFITFPASFLKLQYFRDYFFREGRILFVFLRNSVIKYTVLLVSTLNLYFVSHSTPTAIADIFRSSSVAPLNTVMHIYFTLVSKNIT
jgi:hypothetical protein